MLPPGVSGLCTSTFPGIYAGANDRWTDKNRHTRKHTCTVTFILSFAGLFSILFLLQSDSNHLLPSCLTGTIHGIDVYVKITHVYGHKDLNINRRQLTGHSRNWALDTHVRDKIANKTGYHKQSLLRAVATLLSTCMDIRCDDGERWPCSARPQSFTVVRADPPHFLLLRTDIWNACPSPTSPI